MLLELAAVALAEGDAATAATSFAAAGERFASAGAPLGQMLAELGKGDAARAGGNDAVAAAAYRQAATLRRELAAPLAEASRLLGLPPVGKLDIPAHAAELPNSAEMPDPEVVRIGAAARVANTVRFPEFSAEGRSLLADTDRRLAAAVESGRAAN